MNDTGQRGGPFVVVRVEGAKLALPIEVVERMEPQESEHQLDLGEMVELRDDAATRPAAIALKTAAGIVNASVDGLEGLVTEAVVWPLPPLTELTCPTAVRGLLRYQGRAEGESTAVLLDGDALGNRIAEQILTEEE